MEQFRKEVMGARLVLVKGRIQSSPEKVVHLVADRLVDRSHDLKHLADDALGLKHGVVSGPTESLNGDRRDHPDSPGAETSLSAQCPGPAAVRGFSLGDEAMFALPQTWIFQSRNTLVR